MSSTRTPTRSQRLIVSIILALSFTSVRSSPIPAPSPTLNPVVGGNAIDTSPSVAVLGSALNAPSTTLDVVPTPTASQSLTPSNPSEALPLSMTLPLPLPSGRSIADLDRDRVSGLLSGLGDIGVGHAGEQAQTQQETSNTNANTNTDADASNPQKREPSAQTVPVTNTGVTYTARVSIGSPAQTYTLLVDTGSSNTWVGATSGKNYDVKKQAKASRVSVSYGSGSFQGLEYTDTLSLSPLLTISSQSFGSASSSTGFTPNIDGILGLGPTALTRGTVQGQSTVPTVLDNLAKEGKIPKRVFGVSFSPVTVSTSGGGSGGSGSGGISFGAPDAGAYTGDVTYTDIPKQGAAAQFWGLESSITYGNSSSSSPSPSSSTTQTPTQTQPQPQTQTPIQIQIQPHTSGILDTGTTLILLSTSSFNAYAKATGAVMDPNTGLLRVSQAQFDAMASLWVEVGGKTFEVTKDAQRWPAALNEGIGGKKGDVYLVVQDMGSDISPNGGGLDFVLGYTFLERFYSVYDAEQGRVGLAATKYTNAVVNN